MTAGSYGHPPPFGIECALESDAHSRSQVAFEQPTEHWPVQVTWQVAPSPQVTLPLWPTVTVQVDLFAHSMVHESPQVPAQVF